VYNYIKEELEDSYAYLFSTPLNRIYTVSFDASIYADFLESYPSLLKEGYGLSFHFDSYGIEATKVTFDKGVAVTIHEIINDFLESKGKTLLYYITVNHQMEGKQLEQVYSINGLTNLR
jgi:hypothetical protein